MIRGQISGNVLNLMTFVHYFQRMRVLPKIIFTTFTLRDVLSGDVVDQATKWHYRSASNFGSNIQ